MHTFRLYYERSGEMTYYSRIFKVAKLHTIALKLDTTTYVYCERPHIMDSS